MVEEIIDIYDEKGNKIGKASKKEAHLKGFWHKAVHIWMYNSKGEILLQKGSNIRSHHPGLWDISAAGHVISGEKPDDAAIREIEEELGIKVKLKDLKSIATRTKISDIKVNYFNKEFDEVYLFKFDGEISDLSLKDPDIECFRFIPLEKLESDIKNSKEYKNYVPHGDYYLQIIDAIRKELTS